MKTSRLIIETGNRYGCLRVTGLGVKRKSTFMWECICDCGNTHQANGANLRSGDVRSCGRCGAYVLPGDEAAFRQALNNYRKNAEKRGLEFGLTAEYFRTITKMPCDYCGAAPDNVHRPTRDRIGADVYVYNGIDRIDNTMGYVPDNVAPCCSTCNAAKSKMTAQDFLKWIGRVASHSASRINLAYKG